MGEGPSDSSDPSPFHRDRNGGAGSPWPQGAQGSATGSILPGLDATSLDSSNYSIQMVDTNYSTERLRWLCWCLGFVYFKGLTDG